MARMTWNFSAERVDTPDATALRRDYFGDVAGRYFGRVLAEDEYDEDMIDDGLGLLAPPTGAFLVGRYEGKAAACGGIVLLDGDRAELTRVFLRPAFRGLGGADLLMTGLEDAARALGARRMVLNTRLDLVEARALYVRHGYGEIPAYCSGPYMDIWYGREL
ncbi:MULTISPECIES: GNAT family N-acetyltransferase [Streptomyces]|uniref:GNAT family N-acetyltransferase n=1 Tax=Streptomyces TaxID=1883 RepID=UPI0005BC34D8|nr:MULTISPECIES: GNAT family N-acetyltransferase [unclassified Streptomyces]MCM1946825.1 GNAT family N-acetyltransferase [Streptomyces sp. G2]